MAELWQLGALGGGIYCHLTQEQAKLKFWAVWLLCRDQKSSGRVAAVLAQLLPDLCQGLLHTYIVILLVVDNVLVNLVSDNVIWHPEILELKH